MLFNSIPFLYFFLPVTYFVFWRLRSRSSRYIWLTLTGYVFYSFWDYRFCALMALSTVISYIAGLAMFVGGQPVRPEDSASGFRSRWTCHCSDFSSTRTSRCHPCEV